eukprot:11363205-Ditylum_brightwellii.AAC.1
MALTPAIFKQVHKLVELDEMPKGLKISNRANNVLFDSVQITESESELDSDNDDIMDSMGETELVDIFQAPLSNTQG